MGRACAQWPAGAPTRIGCPKPLVDDDDRSRIRWLATGPLFGPLFGLLLAATPFALSTAALVFSHQVRETGSLFGIPVVAILVTHTGHPLFGIFLQLEGVPRVDLRRS